MRDLTKEEFWAYLDKHLLPPRDMTKEEEMDNREQLLNKAVNILSDLYKVYDHYGNDNDDVSNTCRRVALKTLAKSGKEVVDEYNGEDEEKPKYEVWATLKESQKNENGDYTFTSKKSGVITISCAKIRNTAHTMEEALGLYKADELESLTIKEL